MRRLGLLAGSVLILAVLVVSQLALPGLAAQRVRDQLSKSGQVLDVQVHAFPAVELLWHRADRVVIRMASYRSSSGSLGSSLAQTAGTETLDASAARARVGLLTLRDVTLHKRGDRLSGSARVAEEDLRAAVPLLDAFQPIAGGGGQLTFRGTVTLLGVSASVEATVALLGGRLLVQPNTPFGGLATITAFADPHLQIQSLNATPTATGFWVAATGRLH